MHVTRLGKRIALTVVTAIAMTVGMPSTSNAAGGTSCLVNGNRLSETFAVYDLSCVGTPETTGAWHLQDNNGAITGTGPNGATVNGRVISTVFPICVTVYPTWSYCETIEVEVCINGWCYTTTITICIYYNGPGARVCIDRRTAARGPFTGAGTIDAFNAG